MNAGIVFGTHLASFILGIIAFSPLGESRFGWIVYVLIYILSMSIKLIYGY